MCMFSFLAVVYPGFDVGGDVHTIDFNKINELHNNEVHDLSTVQHVHHLQSSWMAVTKLVYSRYAVHCYVIMYS